jgi:ankyrin repeat protein
LVEVTPLDFVASAALGQADVVLNGLGRASTSERCQAMALAAPLGQSLVVRTLLAAGEDPNQFNPADMHEHRTPLHHAAGGAM